MTKLLSALTLAAAFALTGCASSDKSHDVHGHDHAGGATCCGTDGSCCQTGTSACCGTDGTCCKTSTGDQKSSCATCKAVGKENCPTCKG